MKKTYIEPRTTVVKTELEAVMLGESQQKITDVITDTTDQKGDYNSEDVLSKEWNASLLWGDLWDDDDDDEQ